MLLTTLTLTFTLMADENPKEFFDTGAKWTEIEKKKRKLQQTRPTKKGTKNLPIRTENENDTKREKNDYETDQKSR